MNTTDLMNVALAMARLTETPADSEVVVPGEGIRKVLVGVDIEAPELLMAREFGCDAVIAHHAVGGRARLRFPRVFDWQERFLQAEGVAPDVAKAAVAEMRETWHVSGMTANLDRVPGFARALGMPLMNIHLPLDLVGRRLVNGSVLANLAGDATVGELVESLATVSELRDALTRVECLYGDTSSRAGRVVFHHGAGTNGGDSVYRAYVEAGVGTVIYIHIAPDALRRIRAFGRGNLVVTGHIASDMIGINAYIQELESRGLEVARLGGC